MDSSIETNKEEMLMRPDNQLKSVKSLLKRGITPVNKKKKVKNICIKHANTILAFKKLQLIGMLRAKDLKTLCSHMCCDVKKKECMYRECNLCRVKQFPFLTNGHTDDEEVTYQQWTTTTKNKTINNNPHEIKITHKSEISRTISCLKDTFQTLFVMYCKHIFNIHHQSEEMNVLKNNLRSNDVLICLNFSENFSIRYSDEMQSMLFGDSKCQISLHAGTFYMMQQQGFDTKSVGHSFCTVSDCLNQTVHSVWAHLTPIIKRIHCEFPEVNSVHFLSDSEPFKYKNRYNCLFLVKYLSQIMPNIQEISWNYYVCGHGKGPVDGIGGMLKSKADYLILKGETISSASDFVKHLSRVYTNIQLVEISIDDIHKMRNLFQDLKCIPSIPSITNAHQITWTLTSENLHTRELSCFSCGMDTCKHYYTLDVEKLQETSLNVYETVDHSRNTTEINSQTN